MRLMTLGNISVMFWIHTSERQHNIQLTMPSLHMVATICLNKKSQSFPPGIVAVFAYLLMLRFLLLFVIVLWNVLINLLEDSHTNYLSVVLYLFLPLLSC